MPQEQKMIEVYAESTPNPAAMKFVVNRMLLADGVVEYLKKEDAVNCPLAFQLFDFSGVKSVFITSNFITITKNGDIDWYEIMGIIREFIRGFFQSGEKLFLKNPLEKPELINAEETDQKKETTSSTGNFQLTADESSNAIAQKITDMLEEYVRPAVEQDGGAIHFKSYHDGVVTLLLKGSCSGCPSSVVTLKAGIENLLKKMIPEVQEVVAEDDLQN